MNQIKSGQESSSESAFEKLPKAEFPTSIDPMLATLVDKPFDSENFIYELKWDGYRVVSFVREREAELVSRNQKSFDEQFSQIKKALEKLTFDVVLDGEVVILDSTGKPNFQALQNYTKTHIGSLTYVVFDILHYDIYDTKSLQLIERKKLLKKIMPTIPGIILSDYIERDGTAFFEVSRRMGIEGIVAKEKSSLYKEGTRGTSWLKMKSKKRQEAIICGFTSGRGGRKHFGALILGQYKNGKLAYIGHTGGGFDDNLLKEVKQKLEPLIIDESPFEVMPKTNAPATWVRPELVCEVEYSELTTEGIMRQPIFVSLRSDKKAGQVKQERPVSSDTAVKPSVEIKNPDKVFWPGQGFTKGDLANYYREVSKFMMPYILDRPQSMLRHPNGIDGKSFFQKDVSDIAPPWAETFEVYSESEDRTVEYLVCKNLETLLFMVNLGCIEINPWNSRVESPDRPDYLILDLDPEDIGFDKVVQTAHVVREVLESAGVPSYPKTSGKTGVHIMVPLGAKYTYDQVKQFGELIAVVASSKAPDFTSIERSPSKRQKKVYIDFLQNRQGQTLSAPYSVRPVDLASVATPLEWEEVSEKLSPTDFTIKNIFKRLDKKGDLFKPVLGDGIDMLKAIGKLQESFFRLNRI